MNNIRDFEGRLNSVKLQALHSQQIHEAAKTLREEIPDLLYREVRREIRRTCDSSLFPDRRAMRDTCDLLTDSERLRDAAYKLHQSFQAEIPNREADLEKAKPHWAK